MRVLLALFPLLFAQTQCSPSACGAIEMSMLTLSGTLTIPDTAIDSLSMQLCWDSVCSSWSPQDAGVSGVVDGGDAAPTDGGTVTYAVSSEASGNGRFTFTEMGTNTYQFEGSWALDVAPSGSATHGTVTWTITSGGTSIYSATIPASYNTGTSCESPYQECNLVLEPQWVSNPADAM
jgi:hypothetical protein